MELLIFLAMFVVGIWWIKRARRLAKKPFRGLPQSPPPVEFGRLDSRAPIRREMSDAPTARAEVHSGTQRYGRTIPIDARWAQPGEAVEISGHTVTGGLFYVGTSLPSPRGDGNDNCLVNTRSKVASSRADTGGQTMSYWPSYSQITSSARLAYLQWLAGGRQDPAYSIGYVFLFLYGLERRLVFENVVDDAETITIETRRLLSIYGNNRSFRNYATELLDLAACIGGGGAETKGPTPSADLCNGGQMQAPIRLHLGKRLAKRTPLNADDCLMWILSLPVTKPRTPITRCFDELRSMWTARFEDIHPAGLAVKPPKTILKVEYRAASGTFSRSIDIRHDGRAVPDIAVISAHLADLGRLFDTCVADLNAYSRLLARQPQARGTTEAAMLLPRDVLERMPNNPLALSSERVAALFGGQSIASVSVFSLLAAVGITPSPGEKLNASLGKQVGALLDKIDVGFEPDVRYGAGGLTLDGTAVLFKAQRCAPVDGAKADYKAARAMVEVAALAAASDGTAQSAEYETIKKELIAMTSLSPTERARLLAFATMVLKNTARHASVLSRVAKLPMDERRRVARSAVTAVLADGHAAPGEVRFLEKLHKAFGLSVDDLYSMLHRGGVEIDDPVVVAAEEPGKDTAIPLPAAESARKPVRSKQVAIDTAKVERIRAETADVSVLLAGIFVEEDAEAAAAMRQVPSGAAANGFAGLDEPHGMLLAAILETGSLSRPAFDAKARELRLLPDGALETINEWAFDRLDEAAVEDDNDVMVPDHLRESLYELRKNA